MADIMNTTVYTKKAVLGFQRFDARMFKSVAWGTHAVFFMLFAIALAVAVYSVTAGGYILFAISIACMAWLGRRYYFLYIAPARKFDSSSFINLRHEYRFRLKQRCERNGICKHAAEAYLRREVAEALAHEIQIFLALRHGECGAARREARYARNGLRFRAGCGR